METTVIGTGSAHAGDRLHPALHLAQSKKVDFLVFDRLGESNIALMRLRELEGKTSGGDPQLDEIIGTFSPFLKQGLRIVGNFGFGDVARAKERAVESFGKAGVTGLKLGIISGDDVADLVVREDVELPELGCQMSDVAKDLICANAYIGADQVVALLDDGAHFVLGGRICDASLSVGAACSALGWALND